MPDWAFPFIGAVLGQLPSGFGGTLPLGPLDLGVGAGVGSGVGEIGGASGAGEGCS